MPLCLMCPLCLLLALALLLHAAQASLEAHLQAKELDNDGYKLLLRKVVSKVIDATSDADMAAEVFMAGTRVAKVSTLIDSYVLYHKQGKLRVSETVRAI